MPKSSAQLDREIEAFLQGRSKAPNMPHAIPDRGYMVALHGSGNYLTSFGSKEEAQRFARRLAAQTRDTYDIVKVQNRGEDRFIVDEIAPHGRHHATVKTDEGRVLKCDMSKTCEEPVTHIDEKGFVYCTKHGVQRRGSGHRCRKLRPNELGQLKRGEPLAQY